MEVVNIQKCCKCKREKESDEHKCCSKCREYFREYHYKNRDKKNEQRKLNHQKNIEHDKAMWQEYYQNNRDKISERKKHYRENNKEKLKEAQQEYMKKIYHCPLCDYDIKLYKKAQHEKSQTHQNNLKQTSETKEEEK